MDDHELIVCIKKGDHKAIDHLFGLLMAEVEQLPPTRKKIFRMIFIEGWSTREVSKQLKLHSRQRTGAASKDHLFVAPGISKKQIAFICLTVFDKQIFAVVFFALVGSLAQYNASYQRQSN